MVCPSRCVAIVRRNRTLPPQSPTANHTT
jgi:hypothetical protein